MTASSLTDARVAIVFGSDTGNTEDVAQKIQDALLLEDVNSDILCVTDINPSELAEYDLAILGIPTWDFGGIQIDWEDLSDELDTLDLSGTTVALYGLGDQFGYADYFVDAMGWLQEYVSKAGARLIGAWPVEGYEFEASRALNEQKTHFCGLAIDEDQQFELTDERVALWVQQIVAEFGGQAAA